MTKYEESARREADEYAKERKKQAEALAQQITDEAEAEVQAAVDDTGAAIREEQHAALAAVDTADVTRRVVQKQAQETLSRLGLLGSGGEAAMTHAAATAARRRTVGAHRTRDEAVASLTEALARREQEITQRRDADILAVNTAAEQDVAEQRERLLKSAYAAEAKETEAQITAAQKAQSDAARLAASVVSKEESSREQIRKTALRTLYERRLLHPEVYIDALELGWSMDQAREEQIKWTAWRKRSSDFVKTYSREGYDATVTQDSSYDVTDRQLRDLCYELNLDVEKFIADVKKKRKGD